MGGNEYAGMKSGSVRFHSNICCELPHGPEKRVEDFARKRPENGKVGCHGGREGVRKLILLDLRRDRVEAFRVNQKSIREGIPAES